MESTQTPISYKVILAVAGVLAALGVIVMFTMLLRIRSSGSTIVGILGTTEVVWLVLGAILKVVFVALYYQKKRSSLQVVTAYFVLNILMIAFMFAKNFQNFMASPSVLIGMLINPILYGFVIWQVRQHAKTGVLK